MQTIQFSSVSYFQTICYEICLFQKKKKAHITITDGNEDMLHKRLQNACVACTESSSAADIHNRRIKNSYFVAHILDRSHTTVMKSVIVHSPFALKYPKTTDSRDVTPYNLARIYRCFEAICCLHFQEKLLD